MDIVCFANDWDGDPLSKKHIMRRLARRGSRVLWVNSLGNRAPRLACAGDWRRAWRKVARFSRSALEGPRQVEERIWVVDPLAAPAYGHGLAGAVNGTFVGMHVRAAAARLGLQDPVHYTFVPASAWVAGHLGESMLVYHAADEYAAFGGADEHGIRSLERRLLSRADLYVACSAPLLEAKAGMTRRSILLRHGVEHEHFSKTLDPETTVHESLRDLPRPVVGFMGLVAEWVDLDLCGHIADGLAVGGGGTLVVVGEARGADASALEALRARPNVRLVGRQPYRDLPRWCRGFDVGILPFVTDTLTRAANPLKLREYLAAGLPVVATDLPEARALAEDVSSRAPDALVVAGDATTFVEQTLRLSRPPHGGPRAARSLAVASEGWDEKVAELERALLRARAASPRGSTHRESPFPGPAARL